MPKGRINVPPTKADGIWFQHRGLPDEGPPLRASATTTGCMLTGPWHDNTSKYPPVPPQPYTEKDQRNFKLSNNFSAHDNRHFLQDHGVYFGNGVDTRVLGKRNKAPTARQHHTGHDYLKHNSRAPFDFDYNTVYDSDFLGKLTAEPPTRRRFPREHAEGVSSLVEPVKLSTVTTGWSENVNAEKETPLQVLAVSQEPFLPANKWKYSYHGRSKCYPHYENKPIINPYPNWCRDAPLPHRIKPLALPHKAKYLVH